jgi:hypothetical protein
LNKQVIQITKEDRYMCTMKPFLHRTLTMTVKRAQFGPSSPNGDLDGRPVTQRAPLTRGATLGLLLLLGGACVQAATPFPVAPTPFAPFLANPNGVAASAFQLFTTYHGDQAHVYRIDALGFAHAFGTLPIAAGSAPAEVYLAISPGLGGFAANDVLAVRGNQVFDIPAAGGTATLLHDFTANGVPYNVNSGITFDSTGLLYVTFRNGTVWRLTSGGVAMQIPAAISDNVTEGPDVGPGFLLVALESQHEVRKITLSPNSTSTFASFSSTQSPEASLIVPSSLCTFGISNGAFFSAAQDTNYLLSYPLADFGPPSTVVPGDVVVPLEGFNTGDQQGIFILDSTGTVPKYLDSTAHVHEASTFVKCNVPPPPSHITLALGAYRNHQFNNLLIGFPPGGLTLGRVFYTNSQVNDIMQNNAVGGNGLISLAHQLITAELNIYYGSIPSQAVLNAINHANSLIGNLVIPPVGSGHLSPSATSNDESVLDTFNSSNGQ